MDVQQSYAQWLKDFASDPETVAELESIRGNDAEIEDRFYTELGFGTAGMRGVLGAGTNRMNRYNVRRATKGLAAYLHTQPGAAERGVVIAYDSRRCSDLFARETAQVLCQEGVKAYLFDALRPVPILSYAVRHLGAAAGVVITASHNPPQYNGYKVYGEDGAQLGPEAAAGVTSFIRATPYTACVLMDMEEAKAKGLLHIIGNKEVDDDYIAQVKTLCVNPEMLAREGGSLSIVYTPLHGSGNVPVRRILKEVGITHVSVVKEQELPDPNFSTLKVPNPEDPAAFTLAMKLADEVGADVIFGTDPDCDRLGVAVRDKEGKFQLLTGNQIGCVLLHYILSSRKAQGTLPANGAAVKSIVSTSLANRICEDYGVEMFETLTGFKFIGEKIQQFQDTGSHTFLFGFEESYGFLLQHLCPGQGRRERLPAHRGTGRLLQGPGHHPLRPAAGNLRPLRHLCGKGGEHHPPRQGRRGPHAADHEGPAGRGSQGDWRAEGYRRAGLPARGAGGKRRGDPHGAAHLRRAVL